MKVVKHRGAVLALVALGGAIGSLARWVIEAVFPWRGNGFPWNTVVTNLIGCLLLGVFVGLEMHRTRSWRVRALWAVGALGSFTTLSTVMFQSWHLACDGQVPAAVAYVVVSTVLGLGAVDLGVRLAHHNRVRPQHGELSVATAVEDVTP